MLNSFLTRVILLGSWLTSAFFAAIILIFIGEYVVSLLHGPVTCGLDGCLVPEKMQRELSLIYVATTLLLLPLSYNFVLKRNLLLDIKNNYKSLLLALVAGIVCAIFSVQTGLGYILASTPELVSKFPSMLMILPFSLGYFLLHDLLPPTK